MLDLEIRPGELNKRIKIQTLPGQPQRNDWNEPDLLTDWTDLALVWAKIEGIAGRELWYGATVSPETTHGIVLRFFRGLNPKWRFAFADPQTALNGQAPTVRIFNITSVIDVLERHVKHVAQVKEQGPFLGGTD